MNNRQNVYQEARKKAAMYNEKLNSREGAAEIIGVHPSTLTSYELGTIKNIPADMVLLMSDAYNAPELLTWHCEKECPIRGFLPLATKEEDIRNTTLNLLKYTDMARLENIRHELIDIVSDGEISDHEKERLENIVSELEEIARETSALKITYEKLKKE